MRSTRLRSINLNLLPILWSLLSTRSVTRTAEQLHMSQPGVSDALAKLRIHYDDELLVRTGNEMQPTQLALALKTRLNESIEALEHVVERESFDPKKLERRFVVSTADSVVLVLVNSIIGGLREEAPGVSVQFADLQADYLQLVRSGEVDLLIGPQNVIQSSGLEQTELYQETLVCIARKSHPKINGKLDVRAYNELVHAAFRANHQTAASLETTVVGEGQDDIVRLPQQTLLPGIVEESDLVALVPSRVADYFVKRFEIQILKPPFEVPVVPIAAFWSRIHDRDLAHRWFRDRVQSAATHSSKT